MSIDRRLNNAEIIESDEETQKEILDAINTLF
jgi:hypothetical protein